MEENVKEGAENMEQNNDFDPSAFAGSGIVENVENNENTNVESNTTNNETNENTSSNEDDDISFSWDDTLNSDDNTDDNNDTSTGNDNVNDNVENTDDNLENVNTDENQNTENNESTQVQGISDEQFQAFKTELGLEANSIDELKKSMQEIVEENERLRTGGPLTNDKIKRFQEFKKLNSEELVKKDLEAQGFSGEKLTETIDTLKDNGLLDIEATKVRNAIDRAIKREEDGLMNRSKEADAKQQADREKSVKQLKGYIDEQTEMFGFKMAKDEESLAKVRENHHKYITSGSFLTEITKSEETLAQSAWLWKHRDTILRALGSKGKQSGRQELLNELGNPETNAKGGFTNPGGNGEFSPSKFNA
jgi:regulator of replication initiation timing